MENKNIQFVATSPDEFQRLLLEKIEPSFNKIIELLGNREDEDMLLTREQTADFLSINASTLWRYTKEGKLKGYCIENSVRVYYKKKEVLDAIKPIT